MCSSSQPSSQGDHGRYLPQCPLPQAARHGQAFVLLVKTHLTMLHSQGWQLRTGKSDVCQQPIAGLTLLVLPNGAAPRVNVDCGAVFPSVPCLSQVHRKGDLGDEADGMKGDTVELLDDDDGCPERPVVCVLLLLPLQPGNFNAAAGRKRRRWDIVKSLNDAGVLTVPTLVSCVPPVNHQTKLVSIFRRPTELDYKRYGLPKSHQEDSYGLTKSAKKPSEFHSYSGKTLARKRCVRLSQKQK